MDDKVLVTKKINCQGAFAMDINPETWCLEEEKMDEDTRKIPVRLGYSSLLYKFSDR